MSKELEAIREQAKSFQLGEYTGDMACDFVENDLPKLLALLDQREKSSNTFIQGLEAQLVAKDTLLIEAVEIVEEAKQKYKNELDSPEEDAPEAMALKAGYFHDALNNINEWLKAVRG